jgi:hypothetical protein
VGDGALQAQRHPLPGQRQPGAEDAAVLSLRWSRKPGRGCASIPMTSKYGGHCSDPRPSAPGGFAARLLTVQGETRAAVGYYLTVFGAVLPIAVLIWGRHESPTRNATALPEASRGSRRSSGCASTLAGWPSLARDVGSRRCLPPAGVSWDQVKAEDGPVIYKIVFRDEARQTFERLDRVIQQRVRRVIDRLAENPRPARAIQLVGDPRTWQFVSRASAARPRKGRVRRRGRHGGSRPRCPPPR